MKYLETKICLLIFGILIAKISCAKSDTTSAGGQDETNKQPVIDNRDTPARADDLEEDNRSSEDDSWDEDGEEEDSSDDTDERIINIHSMSDDEIIKTFPSLQFYKLMPQMIQYGNDIFRRMEWNHIVRDTKLNGNSFNPNNPVSFGELLDAGTGPTSLQWVASIVHRQRLIEALRNTRNSESSSDDSEDSEDIHKLLTSGHPCSEEYYTNDINTDDDFVNEGEDPSDKCISRVTLTNYTAITASPYMRRDTLKTASKFGILRNPIKEILIGNWEDQAFLEGRKFDTILADYLLGAVDGFAPFFQDKVFGRLGQHLKPGGRLYISGLNPIPEELDGPEDVICRITKIRDACIKLAGDRTYREYPPDWVIRHLEQAGLTVIDIKKYPIQHEAENIILQIEVARSKLGRFPSRKLATTMAELLESYEEEVWEAVEEGPLTVSFNYVITAELPLNDDRQKEGSKDEL